MLARSLPIASLSILLCHISFWFLQTAVVYKYWLLLLGLLAIAACLKHWCLYLLIGFGSALIHFQLTERSGLAEPLMQDKLLVKALIESSEQRLKDANAYRYRLHIYQVNGVQLQQSITGLINCYRDCPAIDALDYWQLLVKLRTARSFQNPASFDYEAYLFTEGISSVGYLVPSARNKELKADKQAHDISWADKLRATLKQKLLNTQLPLGAKSLVLSLGLGERHLLSTKQRTAFIDLGIAHLLAISGLHIGFVALFAVVISQLMIKILSSSALTINSLTINKVKLQTAVVLLSTFSYCIISGADPPVIRAFVMLLVFYLTPVIYIQSSLVERFLVALIILLIIEPLAVLKTGFWLSFYATAVLVFYFNNRQSQITNQSWLDKVKTLIKVQLLLMAGLMPMQLLMFGQFNALSPVANLLCVPFVGFILLPQIILQLLLTSLSLELLWLDNLLSVTANFYWLMIERLSEFNQPFVIQYAISQAELLIAIMLLLMFAYLHNRFLKLVNGVALVLIMLNPIKHEIRLINFDVGQGTAILVQIGDKFLVYDTAYGDEHYQVAEFTLIPWLKAQKRSTIDYLIVSHQDADHSGGLLNLLTQFQVNQLFMPSAMLKKFSVTGAHQPLAIDSCESAVSDTEQQSLLQVEQSTASTLAVNMLWPVKDITMANSNDRSCVLLLTINGVTILITGDIEQQVERQLVSLYPNLKVDLLIVPHHGSETSSSLLFLRSIAPKYAIISAGYNNKYRLPDEIVVKRYQRLGIKLITTIESGAIEIKINQDSKLAISRYRLDNRKLWFSR